MAVAMALLLRVEPWLLANRAIVAGATLVVFLLVVGLITWLAALICCLTSLVVAFGAGDVRLLCELLVALVSVTLMLLGPGAYSLDARLFGRRRVVFDSKSHPSEP